jgi:hypothetical protein
VETVRDTQSRREHAPNIVIMYRVHMEPFSMQHCPSGTDGNHSKFSRDTLNGDDRKNRFQVVKPVVGSRLGACSPRAASSSFPSRFAPGQRRRRSASPRFEAESPRSESVSESALFRVTLLRVVSHRFASLPSRSCSLRVRVALRLRLSVFADAAPEFPHWL